VATSLKNVHHSLARRYTDTNLTFSRSLDDLAHEIPLGTTQRVTGFEPSEWAADRDEFRIADDLDDEQLHPAARLPLHKQSGRDNPRPVGHDYGAAFDKPGEIAKMRVGALACGAVHDEQAAAAPVRARFLGD
jgi:hypothetical protein